MLVFVCVSLPTCSWGGSDDHGYLSLQFEQLTLQSTDLLQGAGIGRLLCVHAQFLCWSQGWILGLCILIYIALLPWRQMVPIGNKVIISIYKVFLED